MTANATVWPVARWRASKVNVPMGVGHGAARSTSAIEAARPSVAEVAACASTSSATKVTSARVLVAPAATSGERATTLDPSVADFWNSLGMVLGGGGAHDEAARAFREATRLDAKSARYAYNLGLVLQRAGNIEARTWFERTLALDPAFRPARERLAELGR